MLPIKVLCLVNGRGAMIYQLEILSSHRPNRVVVKKGQTIRLNCKATGFPKPTYAWYKNGGRLSSSHDRFKVILQPN